MRLARLLEVNVLTLKSAQGWAEIGRMVVNFLTLKSAPPVHFEDSALAGGGGSPPVPLTF